MSEQPGFFQEPDDLKEWETMEFDGEDTPETTETPAEAPEDAPDPAEEAAEEPEAPESADEPAETPEEEPQPDAAALQAKVEALEKRIADKDDFNGRLTNELGELRALQEQMLERQSAPVVSDWDELIEENPMAAAHYAIRAGDTRRLEQAKQAMDEYLPGASEMWERGLVQEHRLNQIAQQMQQAAAPIQEQQNTQMLASALGRLKSEYPDYDQLQDKMAETITSRPLLQKSLQVAMTEGTLDDTYEALKDLYHLTADRATDTLRQAGQEIAGEHAAETLRAKQEAQTVSASATADTEQPLTASEQIAERIGAEWEKMEDRYKSGWNITSA